MSSSTNVCEVKYEFNMLAFWRLSSASSLFTTRVGILVDDFPDFNVFSRFPKELRICCMAGEQRVDVIVVFFFGLMNFRHDFIPNDFVSFLE